MTKELISGLIRRLQNIALGLTGKLFRVIPIPKHSDDLGYTCKGDEIHVGFEHTMMDEMTVEEQVMFSEGVFAHELMHQLNTDFDAAHTAASKKGRYEGQIFHNLFNVMEDPAIEYFAPRFFGGLLLRALHFSIAWCYKDAEPIQDDMSPTVQFMCALIHYGDGGLVKGRITDDKARDCFIKVLPIFDKAIVEPIGAKRVAYAEEAFEIARPLWEDDIKNAEAFDKLMQELSKALQSAGKDGDGSSSSSDGPDMDMTDLLKELMSDSDESSSGTTSDDSVDKKMARRALLREAMSGDNTEDNSDSESADENSDDNDDSTDESKVSESRSEKKDVKSESPDKSSEDSKSTPSDSDDKSDTTLDNPTESTSTPSYDGKEGYDSGDDVMLDDEYILTDKEIQQIVEEIENCLNESADIEDNKMKETEGIIDSSEVNKTYPKVSCINLNMSTDETCTSSMINTYNNLLSTMSGGINQLTKQLERIFKNDQSERLYKQNGQISVKRMQQSRMTSRVFTKRRDPDKSDLSVLLVVDASGSMSCGNRMDMARKTCIGLAEVFARLHVPLKVISFTGETKVPGCGYYDVIHKHYVNWKDTSTSRASLVSLKADCQNFDGFSIRYAGQVLKKRPEEHKLMIVISDGMPECSFYHRGLNGITDTKNAIREASKYATVIGVAIGADKHILYEMYGRRFVDINNINMLFEQLGSVIKKEVSSW